MKNTNKNAKRVRRLKGEGGLRQLTNGSWEGIEAIPRKDGRIIKKSVTRKEKREVLLIKTQLRALAPLDNDVCKIEINKLDNEIRLIRSKQSMNEKSYIDNNITVNEYVDYWLWNYRRKGQKGKQIAETTFEDYVQKCSNIKKRLGVRVNENNELIEIKVNELTFEMIEKALLDLFNDTCETTAVQVRNHIYNMMNYAKKKDHIIDVNPLEDEEIHFPAVKEKKERKIIKQKDEEKVISYCLEHWYIDVLMQFFTGTRAGEVRGLRWEDVNFDECSVTFRTGYSAIKQFEYVDNKIVSLGRKRKYIQLKTKSSYRTILVPEEFIKVLKMHKIIQKNLAKSKHISFKETDAIFTTNTYTPLGRNDINDKVKKMVKDLDIEDWEEITSHCLRHGFCYAGLLNDVPLEYMQLLLGHEDISVTREWYAHFDKEKINNSAKKVNSVRQQILHNMVNREAV